MKFLMCMLPIMAFGMADEDAASPEHRLVVASNEFSAKMFNEVASSARSDGKNVVISAFSALSPLAQLGLASVGPSHDEILNVIGLPNDEATKNAFSALNSNLRSVKGVDLKIANRVYIPQDRELNETFAKMSQEVFGSDVKNVDFAKSQEAAATINHWVEENTNDRIKDLVSADSLDASTQAVLVNAIFFKGKWEVPFSKKATADRDFHVSRTKTVQVPTMYKKGQYKYGESKELDAKLLELPYEGKEASLLIILPNEIDGIDALQKKLLDPAGLAKASDDMYETEVDVYLPKFKIESTINLKEVLQKMGINKLFSPKDARLDYLIKSQGDLFVSDAIQKAFIEVNEEGTEAAAASAFGISFLSAVIPEDEPIKFMVDHPFMFILKDDDEPIFTGAYYN